MEDFQRELQIAYRQQLLQHDRATRDFLNRVASLCEQVPDSGPAIARTLQGLVSDNNAWVGEAFKNEVKSSLREQVGEAPTNGASQAQQEENQKAINAAMASILDDPTGMSNENLVGDDEPELRSPLRQRDSMGGTPLDKNFKIDGNTKIPAGTIQSVGAAPGNKTFNRETHVGRLSFIDEAGNIVKSDTKLERVLGPKYKTMKKKFKATFCRCPAMSGALLNFAESGIFKLMSATVIVSNYIFIMLQCDYRMDNLNQEETGLMISLGYGFTGFYTVELIFLLIVYRREFFLGPEVGWNLFDGAIVVVALVEIGFKVAGGPTINASFLRILRFFKISRVLRMFSAMRMFKEIRIMVDALAGCATLFLFCTLMLSIFISIFAIFFVQGAAGYLESNPDADQEEVEQLRLYFSSVSDAMLVLFMACTGGDDWRVYYDAIKVVGWLHGALFLGFMVMYVLAFFNVVTSVFCEKAISLATPTTQELVVKRLEKEHHDAQELSWLLTRVLDSDDGTNTISAENFDSFVRHPEVELFFQVRGCNALSAHKFFDMLCDIQETDKVDFASFISALVKLDGTASSIDTHCLHVRQMHQMENLKRHANAQQKEFVVLADDLRVLMSALGPSSSKVPNVESWARPQALNGLQLPDAPFEVSPRIGPVVDALPSGRSCVSTDSGLFVREWV